MDTIQPQIFFQPTDNLDLQQPIEDEGTNDQGDMRLFTFLLESLVTNRYYIILGLFAHYGVVNLFFRLTQMKTIVANKRTQKNSHTNKKLKVATIGVYWWFLASIFHFESFFWVLWLILIAKTLQNYEHLIKYLDIFSCGNIGFFVYAVKSMIHISGIDVFLPTVTIFFIAVLFRTISTSLDRTTFISRACFGFSVGYITALCLHQLQGQYWKEMGAGYLSSLLVIGFLAHLALISFSKEDDLKNTDLHEDHSEIKN